jgi:hypothetical protein
MSTSAEIEYIDYDKIKDLKYEILPDTKTVTIKCYFTGEKWLCPNPRLEQLCYDLHNWYDSTHEMKLKIITLPKDKFDDLIKKLKKIKKRLNKANIDSSENSENNMNITLVEEVVSEIYLADL